MARRIQDSGQKMYKDAPAPEVDWDKALPPRSGGAASPKRDIISLRASPPETPEAERPAGERPVETPDRPVDPAEKTERPAKPGEPPADQPASKEKPAANDEKQTEKPSKNFLRRHPLMAGAGLVALVVAGVAAYVYWDNSSHFESTDDAFIAARQFAIAPKVAGYIVAVPVTDNQHVNQGDVIARIDQRDYLTALAQAQAQVAGAEAGIHNVDTQIATQEAQISSAQAQVAQTQANQELAKVTWGRDQPLVKQGWATAQQGTTDVQNLKAQQATVDSAQAALKVAQRQIDTLRAQRVSQQATLAQAEAQLDQAKLNLSYTTVIADQPGRVVNLSGAVGQYAQVGTDLTCSCLTRSGWWPTTRRPSSTACGRDSRSTWRSTPTRNATSMAMSTASSRAPAQLSRCCRPKTRPATMSRLSSACRSSSAWTTRRQTFRSARGCRLFRPSASTRALRSMRVESGLRSVAGAHVSDAPAQAGSPTAGGAAPTNPWIIAVLVALAAFMEVLDTTIANVVLPYIAGGMGVSEDEASWVVTTYLVSNAVSLVASPYLARLLGRKTFFLICLGLFSISSLLCAQAWNLDSLLLFRILQGVAGGGMVPVSQSILADAFPPEKRGQAFALFGVAVVVAPVVGPTLGGWLADNLSWRWCFLINGPVGFATMTLIALLLPADKANPAKQARFDVIGFLLVATFLGALEVVLDRGLEDDWFGSNFIVTFTAICALAFVLMIPWELSRKDPVIDMRMVGSRQFGACSW